MNNQFDELAKSLARLATRRAALKKIGVGLAGVALVALLTPAAGAASTLGPLIELSRPNAVGPCDSGFISLPGTWTLDDALDPFVAVSPVNPNNIVAAWDQGLFQNMIAAVSFDGGRTWQQVPVPFSLCSGGPFLGTGDERLCFAANGDLYAIAVVGNDVNTRGIGVCRSTDGGLHWSPPVVLEDGSGYVPTDLPVLTADPVEGRFLYAIWDGTDNGYRGPSVFSRTTDGGHTWEPARALVQPKPHEFVQFSQLFVLPDGTLIDLYEQYSAQPNKPPAETSIRLLRSFDRGQTWSAPAAALAMTPLYRADGDTLVVDPETGQFVSDPTNPSFALDRANGNLYAVWEDGRFSSFQYNDIAFAMSSDCGATWSAPIRVNQTPLNIPALNRQAFLPAIAVAADGTIGVAYYDFRFNEPNPGLPTDYWLARCHPSGTKPATNPANWGDEVRLTETSFNMEACGTIFADFRPGVYFGLATAGIDFVSAFTQVDQDNVTAIFFRRVGK